MYNHDQRQRFQSSLKITPKEYFQLKDYLTAFKQIFI